MANRPGRCHGFVKRGDRCERNVTGVNGSSSPLPLFCYFHADQEKIIGITVCVGINPDGTKCVVSLPGNVASFRFCDAHNNQASQRPTPFAVVSADVGYMILDMLTPVARVSLALCSKDYHEFVKSWKSTAQLKEYRSNFPTLSSSLCAVPHKSSMRAVGSLRELMFALRWLSGPLSEDQPQTVRIPGFWPWVTTSTQPFDMGMCVIDPCSKCHSMDDLGERTRLPYVKIFGFGYDIRDAHSDKDRALKLSLLCSATESCLWLFPGQPGTCMACNSQLTTMDSVYSTAVFTNRQQHRVKDGYRGPLYTAICRGCWSGGNPIFLKWCIYCRGLPNPATIARAYCKMQKYSSEENNAFQLDTLHGKYFWKFHQPGVSSLSIHEIASSSTVSNNGAVSESVDDEPLEALVPEMTPSSTVSENDAMS